MRFRVNFSTKCQILILHNYIVSNIELIFSHSVRIWFINFYRASDSEGKLFAEFQTLLENSLPKNLNLCVILHRQIWQPLDFDLKNSQRVRFWVNNFTNPQFLRQLLHNPPNFEPRDWKRTRLLANFLKPVKFWIEIFTAC